MKRVLRYVHVTSTMGLRLYAGNMTGVYGYSELDWAGDVSDR